MNTLNLQNFRVLLNKYYVLSRVLAAICKIAATDNCLLTLPQSVEPQMNKNGSTGRINIKKIRLQICKTDNVTYYFFYINQIGNYNCYLRAKRNNF